MGIKGEVKKARTLFIFERTRIHIDSVDGLGDFMELEVRFLVIRGLVVFFFAIASSTIPCI